MMSCNVIELTLKHCKPPTYKTHGSLAQAVKPITASRLSIEDIQVSLLLEKNHKG